jgi:hypothetical protein
MDFHVQKVDFQLSTVKITRYCVQDHDGKRWSGYKRTEVEAQQRKVELERQY